MAAKIKEKSGVQAELVPGGSGIFDVEVDGKLIFSKHEEEHFPEDAEILNQLS